MLGDDRAQFEVVILKFDQGTVQKATHKPTNILKPQISENCAKSILKTRKTKTRNAETQQTSKHGTQKTQKYQNMETHKTQKHTTKTQTQKRRHKHTQKQRSAKNIET